MTKPIKKGRTKLVRIPVLSATVAIVVLAGGCGSGGDSGANAGADGAGVTTSSLSKTTYVKKASAACKEERKGLVQEASSYLGKHEKQGEPEAIAIANMAKAIVVPTIEAEIEAIRELGAPAGDEEEIEEILTALETGVDEVKQLDKAQSIETVLDRFGTANVKLRSYGFTACTN